MKKIGQISIEEDKEMNSTINDSMMVPIIPFEKASVYKEDIDDSIFVNDKQTKPYFEKFVQTTK